MKGNAATQHRTKVGFTKPRCYSGRNSCEDHLRDIAQTKFCDEEVHKVQTTKMLVDDGHCRMNGCI